MDCQDESIPSVPMLCCIESERFLLASGLVNMDKDGNPIKMLPGDAWWQSPRLIRYEGLEAFDDKIFYDLRHRNMCRWIIGDEDLEDGLWKVVRSYQAEAKSRFKLINDTYSAPIRKYLNLQVQCVIRLTALLDARRILRAFVDKHQGF